MNHYSNAAINTSMAFFGDYTFSSRLSPRFKEYKQSTFWPSRSTKLFYAKTTISPFIHCVGYLLPTSDKALYIKHGFSSLHEQVLKGESRKKGTYSLEEFIILRPSHAIGLIAWSDLRENAGDVADINVQSDLLIEEMSTISKSAQNYVEYSLKNPFEVAERVFNEKAMGNYLAPIDTLLKLEESYVQDADYQDVYFQTLATYYSFLGDSKLVQNMLSKRANDSTASSNVIPNALFHSVAGMDTLLSLLGKQKVAMLNESHFFPAHRQLVSLLLPELRQQGYQYLALEAIGERDKKLTKRGFPTAGSGFYTREYHMANLIRLALNLGYTLVSYDTHSGNREQKQASAIYTSTIKKDPTAKVLVLAGHSHINETSSEGKKWMASYFRTISGINPLTINQERYFGYRVGNQQDSSEVLLVTPKRPAPFANDLYLINNTKTEEIILSDKNRSEINISLDVPSDSALDSRLVKVYLLKEYQLVNDPLPCFVKYGNERFLKIKIQDGEYVLVIETKNSSTRKKLSVLNGSGSVEDFETLQK
ncbi:hypothetical protein GCM10027275_23870 [Rhabdobacter roseus]